MTIDEHNARNGLLWFALLGGAIAWFARFLAVWALSEFGCMDATEGFLGFDGPLVPLTLITLPFLLVAVAALVVSWRLRGRADRKGADGSGADYTGEDGSFMVRAGFISSAIFVLIILVETVPVFAFLDICRFSTGF